VVAGTSTPPPTRRARRVRQLNTWTRITDFFIGLTSGHGSGWKKHLYHNGWLPNQPLVVELLLNVLGNAIHGNRYLGSMPPLKARMTKVYEGN